MTDPVDIARAVLSLAKAIDPKMPRPDEAVLLGWAATFQGQRVWIDEARRAVTDFYAHNAERRIMPADVIAFCKRQPVWSSREHVIEFLYSWAEEPLSTVIERHTGIQPPIRTDWDHLPWVQRKPHLIAATKKWIAEHEGELAVAAMTVRHEPLELGS